MDEQQTRCGYIALIGRPNVGKSTLLNALLGQKLSITSKKPQTTRHQVLGIKTCDATQFIYVDTPGLHIGKESQTTMNRYMNRAAHSVIQDVDVVLFVIEGTKWTDEDESVLQQVQASKKPVVLVVNKVDKVNPKERLLPVMHKMQMRYDFADIVPVSAEKKDNLDSLETLIQGYLPSQPFFYAEDELTDKNVRFIATELIREKLIRFLGEELPYSTAVDIESWQEDDTLCRIDAVVYVERSGQKAIVIGEKGDKLKSIGEAARHDLEALLEKKVFVSLWVKVRSGWADDDAFLKKLGMLER